MKLVYVYIERPIMELDRLFTYRCDGFSLCRGVRVKVPFGNRNQSLIGFVDHVEEVNDSEVHSLNYEIKAIEAVIDSEPLINEELFSLAAWMAKTCVAPMISCFQCMLPGKLKPKSSAKAVKKEVWIVDQGIDLTALALTKKQREAAKAMRMRKEMRRSDFNAEFKSVGKKLVELGAVRVEEREATSTLKVLTPQQNHRVLQPQQLEAIGKIKAIGNQKVMLLHGVTGSGKTEVFLQLAQQVLEQGKQVLFMVPEIALTPQMIESVEQRFAMNAAIYHSRLNPQEKYEQYMLVKKHQVSIVVGTRSAIFMPFDRLGLIIIDEEHDSSYKQDVMPRYHCRDVAVVRAKHHRCPLLLASATPSLESYARAYKGVYELIEMPKRINEALPDVSLVEMRSALRNGEDYMLSDKLTEALNQRLLRKEQSILLLNRRGYTPLLRCVSCGYVQQCPHCDVALSYHKDENLLKCHTCGYTMKLPNSCPQCGKAAWRYLGVGTQRLEEHVLRKFPQAKLLRMDADTTAGKHAHEAILSKFRSGEADILLGTQMIAKGLDFENVTLVGILNGDALLNRNDYRCAELTYDLLEQASGRSGRHEKNGEVIIQAYDVNHYALTCAKNHDYHTFFAHEMQYRHLAGYPPYAYLASIVFQHKAEAIAMMCANQYVAQLRTVGNIRVLGPAPLGKRNDLYRVRILLKGKDQLMLNTLVWEIYQQHIQTKQKAAMEIDLQPLMLE